MDAVVHLAANTGVGPSVENPRADMESNVIGIFNMLEAARTYKVDKFVFASSGAPIGEVEPPIHEEKAPRPVSPYGASKLAGEGYCSSYFRTFGVKTVSLRFGNVYGPRSKHKNSVVAKFFKQALAGETLEIYGDGNQTRDFIYIDDLIQAICLAVNPMPKVSRDLSHVSPYGEVFQIATHKETTVNEITEEIKVLVERQTGKKVVVKYGEARLGDVKRNFSDISKAKRLLGFEPVFDLPKGLMKTLEYFTVRKA
jgi:UDP-glucose 4-epimerase